MSQLYVTMTPYLLYIFLIPIHGQVYSQIEDIPIEDYEPLNHQENDMDLELLPRLQRSSSQDLDDPKAHFFRYMKSLNGDVDKLAADRFRNIPKPGGFRTIEENKQRRVRRNAETTTTIEPKSVLSEVIQKHLGKPLELAVLETGTTEKIDNSSTTGFKRESTSEMGNLDVETKSNTATNIESSRLKREHKSGEPLEKLTFESKPYETSRESRGATKDQWTKQLYPVRRSDDMHYDDNAPVSSENVRAPRVHFVTQRRLESGVPRSYEREARSKDLNRDYPRDLSREMDYYQPRYSRNYNPPPSPYRNDPYYYRYDSPKDRFDSRYDNYYSDRERSYNPKPKRIIYYATLPDITRTPPNVDLRDRYNYGDRYDDRYYGDRYHTKLLPKSRYETSDRNKDLYPLKVSTDVNVKEIKKNPERRIYSEVDRNRYAYQERH